MSISLPSAEVADFSVYKPVLIMFGLVNGLHDVLKVTYLKCALSLVGPVAILCVLVLAEWPG